MKVTKSEKYTLEGKEYWQLTLACGCVRNIRASGSLRHKPPAHMRCTVDHAKGPAPPFYIDDIGGPANRDVSGILAPLGGGKTVRLPDGLKGGLDP